MNIPLGTPIEIEKVDNTEGRPFRKKGVPKSLGYYAGLKELKKGDEPRVKLYAQKIDFFERGDYFYGQLEQYIPLSLIKYIKYWDRKK